jgi:cyclopropane-fatty-acyl-phospholipid synthase
MSDHDALTSPLRPLPPTGSRLDGLILAACMAATRRVSAGRLRLTLPSGASAILGSAGPLEAELSLRNYRLFTNALRRGSIGVAESYMAGDFETRDLAALFHFFIANRPALDEAGRGHFRVRMPDTRWHRRRDNSRRGSERNIAAHYDLGNAFYAAWLDASMTYSSALYVGDGQSLEDAQKAKLDRIVEALALEPGMRVLEVGCGWGTLAVRLAAAGANVTAITISRAQLEHAERAAATAGVADRLDLRFCDYRDIAGSYDRIVSVEMIEAVGEAHWPSYFAMLRDRLAPTGHCVIQAITIAEANFERYRAKADFIQRYVFPGGMLPTERALERHAHAAALAYAPVLRFGRSYARTLVEWRRRFEAAWPQLAEMGFDERFRRMWLYYLTYCEVGFERATIDVGLYRLAHPPAAAPRI